MGLLSKVFAKTAAKTTLDEMGNALVDRLVRLPRTHALSDMALNMLKTYVSFKAGALLFRDDSAYKSYSILGFGKKEIQISLDVFTQNEESFMRIAETDITELKDCGKNDVYYWVFNLSDENLPQAILLLSGDADIHPEIIKGILEKTASVFLPFEKKQSENVQNDEITIAVHDYFKISDSLHCCVFFAFLDEEIQNDLFLSVENFGKIFFLRENTFLLLFPISVDAELLIHHLNKDFAINVVEQFSADTVQKVLDAIQNYT
jgi:hypothetical protein